MESKGLGESSSGLELTIATPAGIDLNSLFGSNGGNGSSDENAAEVEPALLDTINHSAAPHAGEKKDVLTRRGMDVEGSDVGGGSFVKHRQYRKLSQEQNKELEATFQQANFIDKRTKEALAERLKITLKQVDVWFMNRRSRLRKQQTEETHVQHKQQVEELTRKNGRLQLKIERLKKRKKELKRKLKEATPQAAPPPQPSPSVMLLPLPAGLNDVLAAALNTQQGSVPRAPPLPPSGGGPSI